MARFVERRAGPLFLSVQTDAGAQQAGVRSQPSRNYVSNDDIETPPGLAKALVELIRPEGRALEPCAGGGAFLQFLPPGADWCEIKRGRDFFQWHGRADWVITNPPWSQIRAFLRHSLEVADNVAFLMTVNHAWTRARVRDVREAGFGLRRIILVETPRAFPPSGFQLGMIHYSRAYAGTVEMIDLPGTW